MTKNVEIIVFPKAHDLFLSAAKDFSQRAIAAVEDKGEFSVALSGGNTPKLFYDTLTGTEDYKKNIPWPHIRFFFGDERYVPADSEQSNYHLAYKYLFTKLPVNPENIFPIPTDYKNPQDAAKRYEQLLRSQPLIDVIYLGLGDNGHTASLMPSSDVVKHYAEKPAGNTDDQLVASLYVAELGMYRITLTPPAINSGKDIIFLVTGANKDTAVWEVLKGKRDPLHYPAQLIHCAQGKTIWYLDQAAGGLL